MMQVQMQVLLENNVLLMLFLLLPLAELFRSQQRHQQKRQYLERQYLEVQVIMLIHILITKFTTIIAGPERKLKKKK